jgi:hypothetical protein
MQRVVFFFAVILISISSCIDDVDNIKLPNVEPKLVVQSFITPNDSVKVHVWLSSPINYNVTSGGDYYDDEFVVISNADVLLTNQSGTEQMLVPFDSSLDYYALSPQEFGIQMGETYTLSVISPEYGAITASTTVPSYVPIVSSVELDTLNENEWGDVRGILTGYLTDEGGVENYYAAHVFNYSEYTDGEDTNSYISFATRMLISDKGYDGEDMPFRVDFSLSVYEDHLVHLYALSVDEHYYRFHRSLDNVGDFEDNPFTESTHLYTNIEGGLGVFASYVSADVVIISE